MTACSWTASPAGETARYPCTRHEGGDHVFAGGHRLPLAVTSVTYPAHRPVPLSECLDVAEMLAVRGLSPSPMPGD